MDEKNIEESLAGYKEQLSQLDAAWEVSDDETRAELQTLRDEMKQLISLTEESLLSLKKSKLLSMLEGNMEPQPQPCSQIDDEYAAFQALLGEDLQASGPSDREHNDKMTTKTPANIHDNDVNVSDDDDEDILRHLTPELRALEGSKCRVPFGHHWGQHQLHNAMVMCVEPPVAGQPPMARVMFSNPTHRSMLPCQYFLDGKCRFESDSCRYSHGHILPAQDIQDYIEPDFSLIKVASKCMACDDTRLWHAAVIVDILEGQQVKVMWDHNSQMQQLPMEQLWPMDSNEFDDSSTGSSSEDEGGGEGTSSGTGGGGGVASLQVEEDDDDELPVYLWRPPTNSAQQPMAEWEKYTTGIGSRLMKKMGYILGEGLGRDKTGRAEPVPIQLLPQGKSLDKIMELKELAGDRDLYDVIKAQRKKQNKIDAQAEKRADKLRERTDVFDFINHKLSKKNKTSDNHSAKKSAKPAVTISERDLDSKSDTHISVQICQTDDEIRTTKRKLEVLKGSLKRNTGVNNSVAKQVQQRINETEAYLNKLRNSQLSLERHKQKRSSHKKLTIF